MNSSLIESARPAEELQALLNASVDGIIVIDQRGNVQVFNRAAERLFGYSVQEVLGANVSMLMSEPDRSNHDESLARYQKTKTPHIIGIGREVEALRKDGSVFPAFLSVGAVEGDGPGRFVGFIQDITARRRAEAETRGLQEQLAHVSRLAIVGEMSAGIAHELNQPLTAASNYAQACDRLLGRENPDIAEVRDALRQITAQAERSAGIIRKLRGLASNDSKVLAMSDINLIIEELTDLVLGDAKKNKIHYVLDLERSIPQLEVDSAQIQQVIFSLVRNAMEALIESAVASRQIIVRTRLLAGHDVEIAVLDNGPGVSAEVLPRLFDPFCSSKPHGTGLGLATSRTIAKSHHGSLTYISNDPSGACFILRLPIPDRSEK
jgi:two-component system sensor kinase FixL